MDTELRDELNSMLEKDRVARTELWRIVSSEGPTSAQYEEARGRAEGTFAANTARLARILERHGWPGEAMVGKEACEGTFLLLQHADLDTQKRFLPLLRAATDAGDIGRSYLPLLEDRVRMRDGEKQIYGTQLFHDVEGKPALWPIEDEAHVDERRARMDLEPLATYLARVGLEHLDPGSASP